MRGRPVGRRTRGTMGEGCILDASRIAYPCAWRGPARPIADGPKATARPPGQLLETTRTASPKAPREKA
eukprot:9469879-Pyramimonas_sp.AAC.1